MAAYVPGMEWTLLAGVSLAPSMRVELATTDQQQKARVVIAKLGIQHIQLNFPSVAHWDVVETSP